MKVGSWWVPWAVAAAAVSLTSGDVMLLRLALLMFLTGVAYEQLGAAIARRKAQETASEALKDGAES